MWGKLVYNLLSLYIVIYLSSRESTIVVGRILAPQFEDADELRMSISSSLPKLSVKVWRFSNK